MLARGKQCGPGPGKSQPASGLGARRNPTARGRCCPSGRKPSCPLSRDPPQPSRGGARHPDAAQSAVPRAAPIRVCLAVKWCQSNRAHQAGTPDQRQAAPFTEGFEELLDGPLLGPEIAVKNGGIRDRAGALLRHELFDQGVSSSGILDGIRPLVFSAFPALASQLLHASPLSALRHGECQPAIWPPAGCWLDDDVHVPPQPGQAFEQTVLRDPSKPAS